MVAAILYAHVLISCFFSEEMALFIDEIDGEIDVSDILVRFVMLNVGLIKR